MTTGTEVAWKIVVVYLHMSCDTFIDIVCALKSDNVLFSLR